MIMIFYLLHINIYLKRGKRLTPLCGSSIVVPVFTHVHNVSLISLAQLLLSLLSMQDVRGRWSPIIDDLPARSAACFPFSFKMVILHHPNDVWGKGHHMNACFCFTFQHDNLGTCFPLVLVITESS